jgi:hypothetical protein
MGTKLESFRELGNRRRSVGRTRGREEQLMLLRLEAGRARRRLREALDPADLGSKIGQR